MDYIYLHGMSMENISFLWKPFESQDMPFSPVLIILMINQYSLQKLCKRQYKTLTLKTIFNFITIDFTTIISAMIYLCRKTNS